MADWDYSGSPAIQASSAAAGGAEEAVDRTSVITGRLKSIYRKTVLPVEKRYKYDYFYESPFLSDSEFDGTFSSWFVCRTVACFCRIEIDWVTALEHLNAKSHRHSSLFEIYSHSQASSDVDRTVQCR